jgi:cytochrome c oxidase subunit II
MRNATGGVHRAAGVRVALAGIVASLFCSVQVAVAAAAPKLLEPASAWDSLWHTVVKDIAIMGTLFALVTAYFLIRYRRRKPDEEGKPPRLTAAMAVGWTLIPTFIFMADDFYIAAKGWNLWNIYRNPPAERMEIKLMSGMYSWDYTYPNGAEAQNELRVPAGKPILLRMTSRDTIHSHYIPDFRVKEDSMPGRVTFLWFYPAKIGEHVVTCGEFCGIGHSYMAGKIVVMAPADFEAWYKAKGEESKLSRGELPAGGVAAATYKIKG